MILKYIVDDSTAGYTVKQILKSRLSLSTRLINKLKYQDKILCNSVSVHINHVVQKGFTVEVLIELDEENNYIVPENIPVDIIYEDEAIIAVNKQPGIVVHPTCSHPSGTIANGLVKYYNEKDIFIKIRPVSRLDRDTSGVIIFAKNPYIQESLIKQMGSNGFEKEYYGIASGILENRFGTIDRPIERKPGSIMLRHVSETGSPSVTNYEVIEYLNNATFVKFHPITGRTHQIRVHCQSIGHPLIGDFLYSEEQTSSVQTVIERQALHSYRVSFFHPITSKKIELYAPIPPDFNTALEILRK
ncbi:MAG: RluA family pseudouridine synthase [Bacillota bacterium]|nr:RluA family pseudouridine synthase [Bacillota bacterium]